MNIDIIIPAYNASAFILETLHSVARQTLAPSKVIVVDDGSLDNTAEIVQRYANTYPEQNINLVSQKNKGIAGARNTGLKVSTAEFVALLDADDLWEPEKLERQSALFKRLGAEKLGLVYCDFQLIDENSNTVPNRRHVGPRLRGHVRQELCRGNQISGSASAVLIRSAVLKDVGQFDESLVCCEDWDLWLRISKNWEVDFVPEALVCIRRHSQSIQRDNRKMLEGDLCVAVKLSDEGLLTGKLWLALLGRMRLFGIRLADFKNCLPRSKATEVLFSQPFVFSLGTLIVMVRHIRIFINLRLRCWGLRSR